MSSIAVAAVSRPAVKSRLQPLEGLSDRVPSPSPPLPPRYQASLLTLASDQESSGSRRAGAVISRPPPTTGAVL